MKIGRRGFLMAGGAIAGAGVLPLAVRAAPTPSGRSVADFGVEPNSDADQTKALQRAIDEIAASGHPVLIPGGSYRADTLHVTGRATITGVEGATELRLDSLSADSGGKATATLALSGIRFAPGSGGNAPQINISKAYVSLANCFFSGDGKVGIAIRLESCPFVTIDAVNFVQCSAAAIEATRTAISITASRFENCGIGASLQDCTLTMTNNHLSSCGIGAAVDGLGVVNANVVTKARAFGLKLGDASSTGSLIAQGNLLRDCHVGIGVAPSGTEIFASLNMIHGAKNGAIRAFDGDKLIGPDLARESSESYLNLTLAGNVAR